MAHQQGYCRHCARFVVAPRPSRIAAWLGIVAITLGMVGAVLVASLIGPFIMFALPFMALFGLALGPLSARLSEPAACPGCAREVRYRHPRELAAPAGPAPDAHRRAA